MTQQDKRSVEHEITRSIDSSSAISINKDLVTIISDFQKLILKNFYKLTTWIYNLKLFILQNRQYNESIYTNYTCIRVVIEELQSIMFKNFLRGSIITALTLPIYHVIILTKKTRYIFRIFKGQKRKIE